MHKKISALLAEIPNQEPLTIKPYPMKIQT